MRGHFESLITIVVRFVQPIRDIQVLMCMSFSGLEKYEKCNAIHLISEIVRVFLKAL